MLYRNSKMEHVDDLIKFSGKFQDNFEIFKSVNHYIANLSEARFALLFYKFIGISFNNSSSNFRFET